MRHDKLKLEYIDACRRPVSALSSQATLHPMAPWHFHVRLIVTLAILSRFLARSLLALLSDLPCFDSSHQLLYDPALPTLRWDAVHYSSIALNGYNFEQQLAFQPGLPAIMRLTGEVVRFVTGGDIAVKHVVIGGELVNSLALVEASVMLYK